MRRVDLHEIIERQHFLLEGMAQLRRMLLGLLASSQQIGTTDIAHKQGASRKKERRRFPTRTVPDENTNVLRGVPGSVQHLEGDLAHFQAFTI